MGGWALKLSKCEFSVNQLTWLGYDINENGYSPKFSKIEASQSLKPPRTLKQLRSFMGTLNHLQSFIPDLHTHTVHFRASLKACNKQSFLWGEDQNKAFHDIIKMIAKIPSQYQFDSSKGSRVKCDASHNGLGACLEQEVEPGIWVAFASGFLNNAEVKYSTNELELMATVWACEYFRAYLLGTRFQVLADHKAIISALSENYNNKSYQSRLARWADRLLPFDFEVIQVPGVTLGIVDYLSRYPTFPAPEPPKYDELFVVKSIEAFHQALSFINSYNSSPGNQNCVTPQEGVQFMSQFNNACYLRHSPVEGDVNVPQCFNQSYCGMQMDCLRCLSQRASVYALTISTNQGPVC